MADVKYEVWDRDEVIWARSGTLEEDADLRSAACDAAHLSGEGLVVRRIYFPDDLVGAAEVTEIVP